MAEKYIVRVLKQKADQTYVNTIYEQEFENVDIRKLAVFLNQPEEKKPEEIKE